MKGDVTGDLPSIDSFRGGTAFAASVDHLHARITFWKILRPIV